MQNIIDTLTSMGFICNLNRGTGTISRNNLTFNLFLSDTGLILSFTTLSHDVGYEDIELLDITNPTLESCQLVKDAFDNFEAQSAAEQAYLAQEFQNDLQNDVQWLQDKLGNDIQLD